MNIAAGQRRSEALMTDTCTWSTAESGYDPDTGVDTEVLTEVWSGPCRQQDADRQAALPVAGEATFTVADSRVDVPVWAPTIEPGMVCQVTASQDRPETVGRRVRAVGRHRKTFQTAQRIPVEEVG